MRVGVLKFIIVISKEIRYTGSSRKIAMRRGGKINVISCQLDGYHYPVEI